MKELIQAATLAPRVGVDEHEGDAARAVAAVGPAVHCGVSLPTTALPLAS
jgi:hypothetical protein